MSYDLILLAKDRSLAPDRACELKERLDQAEAFRFCEVLDHAAEPLREDEGSPGLFTVCLTSDERAAERAFAELKSLARQFGLAIEDPQAGEEIDLADPQRLPPLYGAPPATVPRRPWWRFW